MKKRLLVLSFLFLFINYKSQVIFCPPGAEWRYNFSWIQIVSGTGYSNTNNVPVKYIKDSIMGSETVKVLSHAYFFKETCTSLNSQITLIKQKGDTIFMRNQNTGHNWQILYNFATMPGDYWINIVKNGSTTSLTYTVTVDSVNYVNINNFNLKRLFVRYNSLLAVIIERIGANAYLFNFDNGSCDGPADYSDFLCYQDNSFGTTQFTSKPCDYSNLVGVPEWNNNSLKIYPNPASEVLSVDLQNADGTNYQIRLVNLLGKAVPTGTRGKKPGIEMDLHELKSGVYFLQVLSNGKLIATEKFIKE